MTAIVTFASAIALYFLLLPIVGWYRKAKEEMEEDRDG